MDAVINGLDNVSVISNQAGMRDWELGYVQRPFFIPEHSTKNGAKDLAAQLQSWWKMNGYPLARFMACEDGVVIESQGNTPFHGIKSNLVNGFPPKTFAEYGARKWMLE